MKAAVIYKFGGPEEFKFENVPTPVINSDEVLIKIFATSVNPVDWKVRKGEHGKERHFPAILGWDVSGVIEKVGKDVLNFIAGDEVYARPDVSRNGSYAEYIAVCANEISFKPKTTDHITSAAIPLAGQTAWQGIFDHGKLQTGQKILIHGIAGGVGTFALQFAKWKGAYVIGTASERNFEFLKQLGADELIDYHTEQFEETLRNIDLVFDTIGGETQKKSAQVLKPGGVLVSTVGIQDKAGLEAKGIQSVQYMAQSVPEDLKQIAGLVDAGIVKPIISEVMSIMDVVKAHRMSEQGHTVGKIVLKVVEE